MLKGHVFSKQLFEHPIFALFINTFLNGENGVSNNYKNGMQVTYSGSTLTVDSGAVCIQGRFLEEDTSTSIATGTNNAYCKLVIEIDLDKQNTESQLNQAAYKVITSASGYPNLTQTNIVKNVSGIYQYELARFRTSSSGITDFQDMRTFLDFDSIFEEIRQQYGTILKELQDELASVVDGSDYLLKSAGGTVNGKIIANGGIEGDLKGDVDGNAKTATKLQTARTISLSGDVTGSTSFDGSKNVSVTTKLANIAILSGKISASNNPIMQDTDISYPSGFTFQNSIVLAVQLNREGVDRKGYGSTFNSSSLVNGSMSSQVTLNENNISLSFRAILLSNGSSPSESNITVAYNYKIVLMKI